MTMQGMDTVAGKQAGERIASGSHEIAELAAQLDGVIKAFDWFGPDAERTRDTWSAHHRPQLDTTSQHLAELATLIKAEADQQDQASDQGVSSGAAGTAIGGTGQQSKGVFGWISDHVGTFFKGLVRAAGQVGDFAGKVTDVMTGQKAWSVSALAASAVSALGATAGAVVGGVKGEDVHWFDEGTGVAGTPVAAPTNPNQAGQFSPVVTQPHDLPSIMQGVTDAYQVGQAPGSTGDVRILKVDNGTGVPSYIVNIPGTETWSPSAGANPHDLTANLAVVSGQPTAAAQSVSAAMDAAGIPPGSQVMLAGHSQAGIVAAQLASDPSFVSKYGVTHVLTYGAPIDHITVDPSVQVMQVAHGNDIVPMLDLGGVRETPLGPIPPASVSPGVTLGSPGGTFEFKTNHDYVLYQQSVASALRADTPEGAMLRQYQQSLSPFFGTATAVDVPVRRDGRP
jgi:hypothetical protein